MHDELREGCIEDRIVERQLLGGRASHIHSRIATSRGSDEGFRRVHGANSFRSDSFDEFRREGARPAADVHYPLSGSNPAQVRELGRELRRISADEPVIGFSRNIESHDPESKCVERRGTQAGVAGKPAAAKSARSAGVTSYGAPGSAPITSTTVLSDSATADRIVFTSSALTKVPAGASTS